MRNQNSKLTSNPKSNAIDVSLLVQQVLKKLHPEIETRDVSVETDLADLVATCQPETVQATIQSLVRHALGAMPDGGEISVTLIDGNCQWELEIADSSNGEDWHSYGIEGGDLPTIVADELDAHMTAAHQLAMSQGGQIQTWNCPQGGIANVLVIPKLDQLQTNPFRRVA